MNLDAVCLDFVALIKILRIFIYLFSLLQVVDFRLLFEGTCWFGEEGGEVFLSSMGSLCCFKQVSLLL